MCKQLEIYCTGIYVNPYSTVLITMKQDVRCVKLCNLEATDKKKNRWQYYYTSGIINEYTCKACYVKVMTFLNIMTYI